MNQPIQTRRLGRILPGQPIRAPILTELARAIESANSGTAVGSPHILPPDACSWHIIQGTGSFPAVGKNFGVDIWPFEVSEWFAYQAYSTGGTWSVQVALNGVATGPVISANTTDTVLIDPWLYAENKRITLEVSAKSGTVKDFVLVFYGRTLQL